MHNCRSLQSTLVDLAFSKGRPGSSQLSEIEQCWECAQEYLLLFSTVQAFERLSEQALPDEGYWDGYHQRVIERLAASDEPQLHTDGSRLRALPSRLRPFAIRFATATAVLLVAVAAWTGLFRSHNRTEPSVASNAQADKRNSFREPSGGGRLEPKNSGPAQDASNGDSAILSSSTTGPGNSKEKRRRHLVHKAQTNLDSETSPAPLDHQISRFSEEALILLRSLKNARASDAQSVIDASYEEELSRELLGQSLAMRSKATMKDNPLIEDLLESLEPVLVAIANMPDRPTGDDISTVRSLVSERGIIPALKIHLSAAKSREDR